MINIGTIIGMITLDTSGISRSIQQAQTALGNFGGQVDKLGADLSTIGTTLSASLTVPIVGIGTAITQTAADFESQMNILGTAAGGGTTSLEELRRAAIQAGSDTELVGVSASDVAEAMTNLYKAGVNTADMFGGAGGLNAYLNEGASLSGVLRAAVDLAAASELDLAQASDVVAISIATFGRSGEDAVVVGSNFVQTANSSTTSVSELADALKNVGPTASAFGFSLEDTNKALAILSSRGIKGGEAGTALKSMMTNMMRQTDAVTGSLAELNIELYGTEGEMKSLPEIIANLDQSLGANATVTRTVGGATKEMACAAEKATEKIPGLTTKIAEQQAKLNLYQQQLAETTAKHGEGSTQAQAKALAIQGLTNDIAENQNKLTEHQNAITTHSAAQEGAKTVTLAMTEEMRNQYVQTIAGTYGMKAMNTLLDEGDAGWKEMTTNISNASTMQEVAGARTQGYTAAMNLLRDSIETLMIQAGTPLIEQFLTPAVRRLTDIVGLINTSFNPAWMSVITPIAMVLAAVGPILLAMGILITVISSVSAAFVGIITFALSPLGLALGALVVAIGAVGMAFGGEILSAIIAFKDYMAAILEDGDYLNDWLTHIPGPLQGVALAIGQTVATLIAFKDYLVAVLEDGDYLNDWLTHIPEPLRGVTQAIGEVIAALQAWWGENNDRIMPILKSFYEMLSVAVAGALVVLKDTTETVLGAVSAFWAEYGDEVIAIITGLLDGILEFLELLKTGWDEHGESIIKQGRETWEAIKTTIGTVIEGLKLLINGFLTTVNEWWTQNGEAVKTIVSAAWQAYQTTIQTQLQSIQTTIQTVLTLIGQFWQTHEQSIQMIVQGMWMQIKGAFDLGVGLVTAVIQMLASLLTGNWQQLGQQLQATWQMVWQQLGMILQGQAMVILGYISMLLTQIQAAIQSVNWWDLGTAIIQGIANGIRNGANMVVNAAREVANSAYRSAKDALGISSPSKAFAELGGYASEGLALGVSRKAALATSAVQHLGQDMVGAFNPPQSGGVAAGAGPIQITININGGTGNPAEIGQAAQQGVLQAARSLGIA